MKYSANPGRISSFVVGRAGSEYGLPMAVYMDQKPWARLKSDGSFMAAFVENGTVAWPGNIDIDPETLYEMSN